MSSGEYAVNEYGLAECFSDLTNAPKAKIVEDGRACIHCNYPLIEGMFTDNPTEHYYCRLVERLKQLGRCLNEIAINEELMRIKRNQLLGVEKGRDVSKMRGIGASLIDLESRFKL